MQIRAEEADLLMEVEEIDVRIQIMVSNQFDVDTKEEVRMAGDGGGKGRRKSQSMKEGN